MATSTLPATPPESVLLSAQDIPTAKHQGPQNVRAYGKDDLFYPLQAAHFVPAERQKDFTMRTSQLVNYVPTKPDKRRDSRYSMFLLRRVLQTTLSE